MLFFWLLCLVGVSHAASVCDSTCQAAQQSSLEQLYSDLGGPQWPKQQGWTQGASYCSWQGVRCCGSNNFMAGSSVPCPVEGAVAGLDLPGNSLSGAWPAAAFSVLAESLVHLNMRSNQLAGGLSSSISDLTQLSRLYIDENRFTGPLPAALGQLSNLTEFSASSNGFSGSLPASLSNLDKLRWLLLDSNRLTGAVDADLLQLPQLEVLNLQNNQLSGALPPFSGTGSSRMSQVALSNNQLTGSIPASWLALPTLALDLSSNQLSGSIPAPSSSNPVLRDLDLSGNRLSGPVSTSLDNLSALPGLRKLDLSDNAFSDTGGDVPQGLVLDSTGAPRAIEGSGDDGPLLCERLVLVSDQSTEVLLDPSTYGYQGCSCKSPFKAVTALQNGATTSLRCVVNQSHNPPLSHVLGPLLAALLVSLIALACIAFAWRCGGFRGLGSKVPGSSPLRMLGGPEAGKRLPPGEAAKEVTLVLTDVQGSTELWEWDSQLASEAFKLHDRVLRQYMTQFYGYEVSTEGDAFLVAFHEPFDAVAWCLCVQLALHYAEWPEALLLHKSTCLDTAGTLDLKRRHRQERWQRHMQREHNNTRAGTERGNPSTAGGPGIDGSLTTNATTAAAGAGGKMPPSDSVDPDIVVGDGALPPAPLMSTEEHETAPNGAAGTDEDDTDSEGEFEDRMAEECARMHGPSPSVVGRDVLFRGLRVRMSVATGGIDAVRLHSVTQRAEYVGEVLRKVQAVGETPQGGQVMLDADTFKGVNARLPELGAVVLEATQKLMKNSCGVTAAELAQMYNAPLTLNSNTRAGGPEEGLRDSLMPRASIDFFSGLSIGDSRQTNGSSGKLNSNGQASQPGTNSNTGDPSALARGSLQGTAGQFQGQNDPINRIGVSGRAVENGVVADVGSDIERGMYRSEPRPPRAQRRLMQRPLGAQVGTVAEASSSTNTTSTGDSSQVELTTVRRDVTPPRRMSYNVRTNNGSSGSLQHSRESDGQPANRRVSSPLASLWTWRSKWGGATSPSEVVAGNAFCSAAGAAAADLETSSDSSREGDTSSRTQQWQQDKQRQGAASPGLLASLRTGAWRSAVQGLGQKGGRSRRYAYDQNDKSVHVSRRRRSSLMYGVMVIDMGVHQLSGLVQKVNLTQIMPCGLEDRARFFSRLDSLRQETPGYFDAPAAGLVPLTHDEALLAGTAMPVVTIVFCTIDKYFEMLSANQAAAELALELYSDCVRWLLLVGGGYECQEAEGTFMVAFSSADVAVEWCLMVQQVLRDMSWPESVLELPTCEEERDMHGSTMFRGPRVKMGVYSGTPTRVMPHTTTGRADYFGPMVNRAARYCHAAARGGQVLLPKELMCEVMSKWVMIDPVELMQSDRLLELSAYFDEDRRLWPWTFKRRSRWEAALPPHLYLPMYQAAAMEEQMMVAAAAQQQQQQYMSDAYQQQQQQQYGQQQRAVASGADGGLQRAGSQALSEAQYQQQQQYHQQQQGYVPSGVAGQQGPFNPAMPGLDSKGPLPSGLRGGLIDSNLAPLQEAAENASSRCTSEPENHSAGHQQHWQQHTDGTAVADTAMQSGVEGTFALHRPGSATVQQQQQQQLQQHIQQQQLQFQQQQQVPPPSTYIDPSGWRVPENPMHYQLQNALMSASGYRRPSYMSDSGSAHPRRSSGSQFSTDTGSQIYCATPANTPGMPTWALGPMIYNWPIPRPMGQGTADYVIPPDRSRRQVLDDSAAADQQQQLHQQGSVTGQQGGRGVRWWMRGMTSPSPATLERSASAAAIHAGQQGAAPLQQVVVQGDTPEGPLSPSGVEPNLATDSARRRAEGVAQRGAEWAAQRAARTGVIGSSKAASSSSRPVSATATAGSSALRSAPNSNSSRGSSGGVVPPAAMLMQGLESQVLPGMLHSSHRLRLVSKRRRQMSYCFFQESCQPGIPANGADPRRLLPMHGAGYPQFGPLAGASSTPGTNYAGSDAGGSYHPGPSAGTSTGLSGGLPAIATSGSAAATAPGSNASAQAVGSGTASSRDLNSNRNSYQSGSAGSRRTSLNPDAPTSGPASIEEAAATAAAAVAAAAGGASVAPTAPGSPQQAASAAAVATAAAAAATEGEVPPAGASFGSGQGLTGPGWAPGPGQMAGPMQYGGPSAATLINNYCGLPEIEPLPDVDVMESLRLGAPRGHRASNMSSLTGTGGNESVAGFEGADVGMMCADIMRGRWLWLRELLVHDVGQFRFKGVGGVHAIVSVTSGELGGRTFPTTIRRGKGQCIKLGRGLLALIQMRPRPRAQPWAGFPPPVPTQGGPSTQPSGPLSGTGAGPSFSGIISDQPEIILQTLTDAAALSGSHAGAPGTPGASTGGSNVVAAEAAWAAAAAGTAGVGSLSSGSNVLGTPHGPPLAARGSPYNLGLGGLEQPGLAWMPAAVYQAPGWVTPSYGHDQASAAAAVAAWAMPMVRAASAGDLRMLPQGSLGVPSAAVQPPPAYGSGLPPLAPPQPPLASAAAYGGWRVPTVDLPVAPSVMGMGRPRANSLLMLPGGGMATRGRRMRSNSYTYGGYADFASSMYQYAGAAAWGGLSPYGSYVVSPASTDSASTGGGTAWQQLPPPPVTTPRQNPMAWQQQQQQPQAHHAQQALQQQQQLQSLQAACRGPVVTGDAQGANGRRRRHSVCMGDPRLQLGMGHHRSRRLSGMRNYGPVMMEMQPWSEVEEWKYMSQELEPSKQQLHGGGATTSNSQGCTAAAGAGGSSSRRTSGSGSAMMSPNSAGLGPLTSPAGTADSSTHFMRIGSQPSVGDAGGAAPNAAAAAAASAVEAANAAVMAAAAAATCSCPCNVVGLEPSPAPSQRASADRLQQQQQQQHEEDGEDSTAAAAVSAAAEPMTPAAQAEAEAQGLASETGIGTLS